MKRAEEMAIELLYFDGCPSWEHVLEQLHVAVPDAEIHLIEIMDGAAAVQERFTGSPTLRVNGRDLFPIDQNEYSLACRVYRTPQGLRGWPTAEMIQAALQELDRENSNV